MINVYSLHIPIELRDSKVAEDQALLDKLIEVNFAAENVNQDIVNNHYIHAWSIKDCNDLEQAFHTLNIFPSDDMYSVDKHSEFAHSLSVGDIVEVNGKVFICGRFGWDAVDFELPIKTSPLPKAYWYNPSLVEDVEPF